MEPSQLVTITEFSTSEPVSFKFRADCHQLYYNKNLLGRNFVVAYCGMCHLVVIYKDKHIHYKQQVEDSNPGLSLNSKQFRNEKFQSVAC